MPAKVCLVFLLVYLTDVATCENTIYCFTSRNEYYIPDGDLCKKCDKCDPGLELEPVEKATFENTNKHGAMGCRKCVRCKEGFFSNRRSFAQCRKCMDCEKIGKLTTRKCTLTTNAKCGKRIPRMKTNFTQLPEIDTSTTSHVANATPTTDFFISNKTHFVLFVIFLILITALVSIVLYLYFTNYQRRTCRERKRNSSRASSENGNPPKLHVSMINDVDTDAEKAGEKVPCLANYTNNNGMQMENYAPTDIQIMFIAKQIAPIAGYRDVALELHVPENEITIIEEENRHCCKGRSYKVLQKWTHLFAEQATVGKLLAALERVGRRDVVHSFYREYKEIPVSRI